MSLTWQSSDFVLRTFMSGTNLQVEFGVDYQEFLESGNLREVLHKARESIERKALSDAKGKGKGKASPVVRFWGTDAESY